MQKLIKGLYLSKCMHYWNGSPDLIGCLGASIILIAYALLQNKRINADSFNYLILNFIGAVLILISLLYAWNLAAVAMEFAWMIISLVGILKLKKPSETI